MITDIELLSFLEKDLPYTEQMVFLIKPDRKIYVACDFNDVVSNIHYSTVKLQNMEKFSQKIFAKCNFYKEKYQHKGPVTCHLFYASSDFSPSFCLHSDLDNVIIEVCSGIKHMEIAGKEIVLKENETVFIPAGTEHRALNRVPNLILSFGLEKFLIDKI